MKFISKKPLNSNKKQEKKTKRLRIEFKYSLKA